MPTTFKVSCENCGKEIEKSASKYNASVSKRFFCNGKCSAESQRVRTIYTCKQCGKQRKGKPSRKRKFCSQRCNITWQHANDPNRSQGIRKRARARSKRPGRTTLVNLYQEQKFSAADIGERFGVQSQSVRKWLHEYGITVRQEQENTQFKPGDEPVNKLPIPPRKTLTQLYQIDNLSAAAIGERYGVSSGAILNWLEYYNIERRQQRNQSGWEPDADTLHYLYWDNWLTYEQIGEKLGVDFTAVPYWFDKFGIPKRTAWETRRGRGWQPPDPQVVCHLYEAETMGMDAIGKLFDVSKVYIKGVLQENRVTPRQSGYPNISRYVAKDGHKVKSSLELQVDDWLYNHGLEHVYEPPIGSTNYRADFLVNGRYIEVWGISGNERYEHKRRKKMKVYERLQLSLLSVFPSDFPHLDILSTLLSK